MNELFGLKHLIIAGLSILLAVGLFFLARKQRVETVCKVMFFVGIVSEIIKLFYYTVANEDKYGGVLPKTDLPFHLCSIQIIFFVIINFTKNEKIHRFLYAFMIPSCLFGGLAAILIATETARSAWIITFQYFIYHACLVAFSLYLMGSKQIKITIKDYFNCLKFLVVLMFFAIYINSWVYDGGAGLKEDSINFMYVAGPPVSGLPFLTEKYGWLVYIAHYACLIVFCVSLVYIKPIIVAIKEAIYKRKTLKAVAEVAVTAEEEKNIDNE